MFCKCVSGVNKFWHFSKIEPNQLSNSALQWCAPCMYYQMPPQMARLRWRITTQVAFEWLFSAVSVCVCLPEKMHNHIDCICVTYEDKDYPLLRFKILLFYSMVMMIVTSTHLTASSSDTFRLLFTRAVRARAWVTQTLMHYKVVIAIDHDDHYEHWWSWSWSWSLDPTWARVAKRISAADLGGWLPGSNPAIAESTSWTERLIDCDWN